LAFAYVELGDIEPAAGGDPGAQRQTEDTQVPCRPRGDVFQGAGDIGVANVIFQREWCREIS